MKLSVVIPAHDEAASIGATLDALAETLRREAVDYEILVVDDHSQDATAAIVQRVAERHPGVRCIANPRPPGFGYAVRAGLDAYTGDAVAIVMADLSYSPDDLVTYFR